VVQQLLAESKGQPGKPAIVCPHGEIGPLNETVLILAGFGLPACVLILIPVHSGNE